MVRAETEVPEIRRKTRSRSRVHAGDVGLRDLMLRRELECLEYETGWWLDRAWLQLVRCALANTCALFPKVRRRKENGRKPKERSEDQLEDRMKSDEVRRSDGPESG
jgi:hypothetical protein